MPAPAKPKLAVVASPAPRPITIDSRRFPALDGLRAIAILLVVAYHSRNFYSPSELAANYLLRFASTGWNGVTLFFVLSGYLVGGLALREIQHSGQLRLTVFWGRRAARTWPLYGLLLAVLVARQGDLPIHPSLWHYLTFTQNFYDLQFFIPSWSLAVEEQFYLLLPLALIALQRAGKSRWLPALAALGTGLAGVYRGMYGATTVLPAVMDGLLVGLALADLQLRRPKLLQRLSAKANLTLILGLALVYAPYLCNQDSRMGAVLIPGGAALGFGLVVSSALGAPLGAKILRSRLAAWISLVSYGAYLSHEHVLSNAHQLAQRLGLTGLSKMLWLSGGGAVAALLVGYVLHLCVEKPCLALRDRLLPRETTPRLELAVAEEATARVEGSSQPLDKPRARKKRA